jgi:ribonuclease BN (tRNA processing enzyme)
MKIQILGAHNIESRDSKCISLLIDGVLAIDAGALTSSLTQKEQQRIRAVLLTHQHYDHIRDIPVLGMNFYLHENTLEICGSKTTYEVLTTHLMDDVIYPDFIKKPPERPTLRYKVLEAGKEATVAGYTVLPVAVNHAVPGVGYQITSADGKKVFYTSDTGPGLTEVWRQIAPDLLIIEVTTLNKYHDFALQSGHLTPALLQKELESYRKINGNLPRIVLVHMNPLDEKGIKAEISQVEDSLETKISFGYEGMQIVV